MKICIVTEYLSYVGGGERVYCNWANMFSKILHHDVTIISMEQGDKPYYKLVPGVKVVSLGLRPARYYQNPGKRKLSMITHFVGDRKKISNYLQDNEFDIVLGIATNINIILSTISVKGIKIATEHSEYYAPNKWIRILRKCLYRRFDRLTVLNYDDEKIFKKLNSRTRVVLNPVGFDCLPERLHLPNLLNKRLISIGSLSSPKNQKRMLDIMKLVHAKYPDWSLVIYGEGPLRAELEAYAEQIGVTGYVQLPGITNDIYGKLYESSVFLLTSSIEGFGLVVVEAMAAGLPCVCFDALGPKMIIKDGVTGFLIPQNDTGMFVERVCTLIEHPQLRKEMAMRAQDDIQQYSFENVAKVWSELFTQVMEEKAF